MSPCCYVESLFQSLFFDILLLGLQKLPNLRVLRISSIALKDYDFQIWSHMIQGINLLKSVTELAIRGIGVRLSSQELQDLCELLPRNLKVLSLYLAKRFRGSHLRIVASVCFSLFISLCDML